MPRMQIYFSADEYAWVKAQKPGTVRAIVAAAMNAPKTPARKLSSADLCKKA